MKQTSSRYLILRIWVLCLAMLLLFSVAHAAEGDYTRTDSTKRIAVSTKSSTGTDQCLIKSTPFEAGTTKRTVNKGGVIYISGTVINKYSNTWYITEDGGFVYSGDVEIKVKDASFTVKSSSRSIAVLTQNDYLYAKPYSASVKTAVSKGEHVLLVQKVVNSYGNTWYKTDGGKYIYSGCISTPADYITINTTEMLGVSTKDASASDACYVKKTPYEDGVTVRTVQKNASIVLSAKIKNKYGNVWYKTKDGYFVYSSDLKFPEYLEISCNYNMGVSTKSASASDACYVKKTPYESGTTVKKIEKKQTVKITGAVRNKYNNLWYKTSEGYIYSGDLQVCRSTTLFSLSAKFKNTNTRYSHVAPDKDSYNVKLIAAGSKVVVSSLVVNGEGNIWARLNDGSYLCFYDASKDVNRLKFDSLVNAPVISATVPTGDLAKGSDFNLSGTISVKAPILYATGTVVDIMTGNAATGSSTPVKVYPSNTLRTLDLAKTSFSGKTINSMTTFNKLGNGKYDYRLYLQLGFTYGGKTFKFGSETRLINSGFTVGAAKNPLVITKQPVSVTALSGSAVKVSVAATGDGLSYQWYYKNPGMSSYGKSSITSASYTVTMNSERAGRKIYCTVSDKYGRKVNSSVVTLTMASPAAITKQPASVSVVQGDPARTYVTATGTGLTYQWYYKDPGMSSFGKSSVTGSAYSVTMIPSKSGRQVYCVVKDKFGTTVRSKTATLKMIVKAAITKQPASVTVTAGAVAKTTVTAVGDGRTYQWYCKDPGMSSFIKSSLTGTTYSVTLTKAKSGRQVYCVVTDKYGNSVKSSVATLKVK